MTRLTEAERTKLRKAAVKHYRKGLPIREVGAELQVSYGAAHRLLTDAVKLGELNALRTRGGVTAATK